MEKRFQIPEINPNIQKNSIPQEERKFKTFDDYRKNKSNNSVTPIDATMNARTINHEEEKESSSFEESLNDEVNSNDDK